MISYYIKVAKETQTRKNYTEALQKQLIIIEPTTQTSKSSKLTLDKITKTNPATELLFQNIDI